MEYRLIFGDNRSELEFKSYSDILFYLQENYDYIIDDEGFYNTSLLSRLFFLANKDGVYFSDRIASLRGKLNNQNLSLHALECYGSIGFVIPPYTQYDGIFIANPFKKFSLNGYEVSFQTVCPPKVRSTPVKEILEDWASSSNKKDILFSGGIDSSALLGISKQHVSGAHYISMTSMPSVNKQVVCMCNDIELPLTIHHLDKDLTESAREFVEYTGELIYDQISVPMLSVISQSTLDINPLIDGQAADSLLLGLPLNKIYDLWERSNSLRSLVKFASLFFRFTGKQSSLQRKLYRVSKALRCLSQPKFSDAIIYALRENNENCNLEYLKAYLDELYTMYDDWHLVLKHFYMFDVLPVREMQKYALANKYGINFDLPFMDKDVVLSLFYADYNEMVNKGKYKYPMYLLAVKYWPKYFDSSETSPFQVNYSLSNDDVKSFSIQVLK
ncbi:asparagine synthase-related protein [Vibrio lentus]|nr:asparagine synthase-related protein [Vibrio lentus]PMI69453.1 hypothetical protein BCU43_24520 [Vibrio lentus]